MWRHRSGESNKKSSAAVKVPKSTVVSIIPEVQDKQNSFQSFFFFSFVEAGTKRLIVIGEKPYVVKYIDKLDKNLMQSTRHLRLGQRFTFQQNSDSKHTAKTAQGTLNVLEWT